MSTIMHEQDFDSKWIEIHLAHADKNSIQDKYNYALHFERRREMLQWYSNYMLEYISTKEDE